MDSSIFSMIAQATLGAQLVLLILILMSLGSWALMIQKYFLLKRAKAKAIEGVERFQKARDLREAVQVIGRRGLPGWLEADGAAFRGVVKSLPQREDIQTPINEDLIVELYSK